MSTRAMRCVALKPYMVRMHRPLEIPTNRDESSGEVGLLILGGKVPDVSDVLLVGCHGKWTRGVHIQPTVAGKNSCKLDR